MALDTSLEGVAPWLQRPAGNELGNQSFLSAFEEAQRQASPMYKAQVQETQQRTQQEAALQPLRMQQMQIGAQTATLQLDTAQQAAIDRLKTKGAMADVAGMIAHVQDWADADADIAKIGERIAKDWTPAGQEYYDAVVQRAEKAKQLKSANDLKLEQIKNAAERNQLILDKAVLDAQVRLSGQNAELAAKKAAIEVQLAKLEAGQGKLSPVATEGKNFAEFKSQLEAEMQKLTQLQKDAQTDAMKNAPLVSAGIGMPFLAPTALQETPEIVATKKRIKELTDTLGYMEAKGNVEEFTVETPGGEKVSLRKGGKKTADASGLGGAAKTEAEKQMAAAETTMSTVSQIIPTISPETVGPLGVIKENLETLANIVHPGSVTPKTTSAREVMRVGTQEIVNAMKTPGMVSNYERAQLSKIGDVTGFLESAPGAKEKMEILRGLMAANSVRNAKRLGREVPDQALTYLPEDLLGELFREKRLTVDDLRRWYRFQPDSAKAKAQ